MVIASVVSIGHYMAYFSEIAKHKISSFFEFDKKGFSSSSGCLSNFVPPLANGSAFALYYALIKFINLSSSSSRCFTLPPSSFTVIGSRVAQ